MGDVPMVPLDATLFTPSLSSAFGLPGFSGLSRSNMPPTPPPLSAASWGNLNFTAQPLGGGATKPMAKWGGAAREELMRRNQAQQQEQQQQEQSHFDFQHSAAGLQPEQGWSAHPTDAAAAQQQRSAFQAFQRWVGGVDPSSGMQASGMGGGGMSVGSTGKQHLHLQQQRSSFEAAQQRPSFESVVAAGQHRPSFESVVAAAQQRSSFEEGVAAVLQQQQHASFEQQQQQQRASFEQQQQQQQRTSFEGGVAASSQLYHAQQQFLAAQANFQQQQQFNSRQQALPLQSFNQLGTFPMPGGHLDFSQQMLTACPPSYCLPPSYQQPPLGHGSTTGTTGTDTTEEDDEQGNARTVKRARLVWTPQLHKRFEEAVEKLGHEKAVPKNIMQEMNVEGLTRENVASHLQKWRLLEKKNGRGSGEGHKEASS